MLLYKAGFSAAPKSPGVPSGQASIMASTTALAPSAGYVRMDLAQEVHVPEHYTLSPILRPILTPVLSTLST